MELKLRHVINAHKALTVPVILCLIIVYQNFSYGPMIYLSLHGTYCVLWFVKESYFPDKKWERSPSIWTSMLAFFCLDCYWISPYLIITSRVDPSPSVIALCCSAQILGVFLHFGTDTQKYFVLKYRQHCLIQDGFFSRSRNLNYFGELLIYFSFTLLSRHWLPFLVLLFFIAVVYYPNMWEKDESLSRYQEFKSYKDKTWLFFPKFY